MGKVKAPIGLRNLNFHPTSTTGYGSAVALGSAVKAYLTIETNDMTLYGDDCLEIEEHVFKRGTLTTETWLDDLELETQIYGGTYSAVDGGDGKEAIDKQDDTTPTGAVTYIRVLIKRDETTKEKSRVYRAVVLPNTTASKSSQKDEADTTGESLDPKTHPVDFTILSNDAGIWRYRADFATEAEAAAYISSKLSAS